MYSAILVACVLFIAAMVSLAVLLFENKDLRQQMDAASENYRNTLDESARLQKKFDDASGELAAADQTIESLNAQLTQTASESKASQKEAAEALSALQTEFDAYKTNAAVLAAAVQTGKDNVTDAKTTGDQSLSALQTEFDAYKRTANQSILKLNQSAADSEKRIAQLSIPTDANGLGNSVNGNVAVYEHGNIIYSNFYDKGNLYIENAAGYGDRYLCATNAANGSVRQNIGTVYKDYLYYIDDKKLCRMTLPSEMPEQLRGNVSLYNVGGILAVNNRLYYLYMKSVHEDGKTALDNLYGIDLNGKNASKITGVRALEFVSNGSYLYYLELGTKNIVRYNMITKESNVLLSGDNISNLILDGDTLYFCRNGRLRKMKTDGTSLLSVGLVNASYINVVGDWIYYSNSADSERIYRITTDCKYNEKLYDVAHARYLNIAGGWVYFVEYGKKGDSWSAVDAYKIKLDGTGLRLTNAQE